MQYVAVRARGASKPFLSCIVSDLKRTLRASTGLQRNIYEINLAAQSTVRWILFSFPAASPEHGPVQEMETSRRLIWLFGGSRHLSVLGWWGEGTRQSSEKDRCTGRCPERGASEAVSPSLSDSDFLSLLSLSHSLFLSLISFYLSPLSVFLPPLALSLSLVSLFLYGYVSLSLFPLSLSLSLSHLSLHLSASLSLSLPSLPAG